ncbi:MAG: hypothetical protein JXB15_18040 [Anaerolineales bacterium]|nr:hypothetical protein [Anaerolineales bacterium]
MMRTLRFTLSILFLLGAACFGGANSYAYAQSTPVTVRVSPATILVALNQSVDLAIEVVNVQAMYGFDIQLTFDPAVVEVVDANPDLDGVQIALGAFMDPGFAIINRADNTAGTLQFVMTQLNPSEAKTGTGNLVVVKFKGKQSGKTSPVTLVKVDIAQRDGTKLPTALVSGQISVVASPPGPTNTNVPTQGPGTPMPTLTNTSPPPNTAAPTNTRPPATPRPTNTRSAAQPTATRTTSNQPAVSTATLEQAPGSTPEPSATQLGVVPPELNPGENTPTTEAETAAITPANSPTVIAAIVTSKPAQPTVIVVEITSTPAPTAQPDKSSPLTTAGLVVCVGIAGVLIGIAATYFLTRRQRSALP